MKKLDHLKTISLNQLKLTENSHSLLMYWVRKANRPYAVIVEQLVQHAVETEFEESTEDTRGN